MPAEINHFMTMAEDYTTLSNPKFLYLAELSHPFPNWVVEEAMPSSEEFAKKASTAFADPARRLLPIGTKSAAFHSAINLFACMEDYDEATFERVKSACAMYGIEDDVAPYANIFADEVEKSASLMALPEGRYAIETTLGGEDFKILPINDEQDVIDSAFELSKMAAERRIHLLMLVPAAREIVKAAADYNAETPLPGIVARLGHKRLADAEIAAQLIEGREQYCKQANLRETVAKDYQEAVALVSSDPEAAMTKIATIDHVAGVEPNYRESALVPNPFDIVFNGPLDSEVEKAAKENLVVREVLVPISAAKAIDPSEAAFKLSKEASANFAKIREADDARDMSLAIENWSEVDQRTFLRLAVGASA